ncbi:MAG: 2-oxo-4-hydroxy-4-carboxy-5-ureidoimidazoline decarboxylase, partial [Rhabdaerophilum sp.]
PYTLDANDMRFATPQGFNSGDQFFSYLKDSFDLLHAEGETVPKMMSIGLHCRLVGRPGRAAALARFLDHVLAHEQVWVATRLDIARHWVMTHPPAGGWRPSQLSLPLFLARFGGVFEHSPWVAGQAHAAGLDSRCDMLDGLHAAMVRAMRAGSRAQQESLVRAHPDLAGRLALAGELTVESTQEQASAGLDRLAPEELSAFTALNSAYLARFGFPFIMAVKGQNKAAIRAAFERRLGHDSTTEFATALEEIEKIARFRLADILESR